MTLKFKTGATYATPLITNSEALCTITVLSRTDKTIRVATMKGEKTLRVSIYNGAEQVKPWGSYSMAPVVDAEDECTLMSERIALDCYAGVAQALGLAA